MTGSRVVISHGFSAFADAPGPEPGAGIGFTRFDYVADYCGGLHRGLGGGARAIRCHENRERIA